MNIGQVYNRADIVNFMGLTISAITFVSIQGFTDGGRSLNASTYDRRYIYEKTERSDVIAYATAIAYGFDRMYGNSVHDTVANVHDKELVGAVLPIVTVNFNEPVEGGYKAKYRLYSIAPDGDGDSTDAYTYSGEFKSNGSVIEVFAKIVEGTDKDTGNIMAVSFTEGGEQTTQLVTFSVSDEDGQVPNTKIVIDASHTVYTDVNGIVSVDLPKGTYSKIAISKADYTTQNNISVKVEDAPVYKAITLVKAS